MSARSSKPVHFLDPNSKTNGTKYRSVICDKRTIYLENKIQKKKPQKRRQNAIDDTIRLRTDFKSSEQAYYVRNKNEVTCKDCLRLLAGKKKNGLLGDMKWEVSFVGTKKAGGWIVVGGGVLKRFFPGASRKNHEAAQQIANRENRRIAQEVKYGNGYKI